MAYHYTDMSMPTEMNGERFINIIFCISATKKNTFDIASKFL